jgi:lia operon protein LiaG
MSIPPRRRLSRLPLFALAAAVLAVPASGRCAERFTLSGDASVHNLAGEVTVAAGSGSAVVVEVTRGGEDGGRLTMNRSGGALHIAYPGDRVVYARMGRNSRSTVTVRRDGSFGGGGLGARRVTVAGSGRGLRAYADVRVLVPAGRTVAVHQGVGRVAVSNVNGTLRLETAAASVRSQGTCGALNVEVGSGSVEVRDAQGDVTVEAGSGSVTVGNVRGNRLDLGTGSGSVSATGVRVQALDVGVGSGSVTMSGVTAQEVTVETGSGAVNLTLAADPGEVEIDTGSGGVTLNVPAGFGGQLEIETGSGGIDVDLPVTNRRTARGSFSGRVGNGQGTVQIETGSGGVRIRRS